MNKRVRCTAAFAATVMAASLLGGCGQNGVTAPENVEKYTADGELIKPEKITVMADGTVFTKRNGRDAFEARWEELTGIDIEFIQPDHSAYYDVVGQTFASGVKNWPDVILLSSTYYSGYAEEGALWDLTETYENSDLKKSGRLTGEDVIDGMRIGGRLYGLPVNRGGGCITYVKKKWLDNCNLEVPTNYDEYMNMLKAFTEGDPDGNGVNGDTYALSAAGFMGEESPYTNYLPEFYQESYPSFTKDENGVWYDGFMEQEFKDSLLRLRDAYVNGYVDKETLTNGTSDVRNKFYEDRCGVFTYWSGTWAENLRSNLAKNGLDDELVPLPPIKELGNYIERTPAVWCITNSCKYPEAVYKYFIESMMDGGDMQTLWTYGVEGVHWSVQAETVCGNTYEEGQFHGLESMDKPGTQYTKGHMDPILSIVEWENDPGIDFVAPAAKNSQEIFKEHCKQSLMVPSTTEMATYNGDLTTLKRSIVADVVVQGMPVEEAYQRFEKEHGVKWSNMIVDSLNRLAETESSR